MEYKPPVEIEDDIKKANRFAVIIVRPIGRGSLDEIIFRLDLLHRLSTAEVENAITQHPAIIECAVVASPHEIKGEVPVAFIILNLGYRYSSELEAELRKTVDKVIGPTAIPDKIIPVENLPKTRSGKIMRRILKSLLKNVHIGDLSTLQNPESIQSIKEKVGYKA